MGGAIAFDLAVRHGAHVAGLGMIASGAYLGVPTDLLDAFSNPLTLSHAFHLFQQRAFRSGAPASLIDRCLALLKETRPSVLAADWQACAAFDSRPAVSQINVPGWVIVGADDQLTPVNFSHFLAGQLPAAHLQIVPDAGHMIILEQPERVVRSLQQFLAALAAARMAGSRVALTPASVEVQTPPKKP
jgi:pimeloyl-ACP methyl ester carboxylesterase